ncbi:MAG: SRPBCC family protein [Pseudobdellovibrio sp.]
MFIKMLVGLVVLIGGFLVYVAFQPADYKITRELLIKAPAEALFPYINNSKKANEWMPWKDSDPALVMSFSGPEEGVGSKSSWESKGQMGTGSATVTESKLNQSVTTQLETRKPMEMTQLAVISLRPSGTEGTLVEWTVTGKNTFVARIFCTFFNMDKMVGGEFEKGLAHLKTLAEGGQK